MGVPGVTGNDPAHLAFLRALILLAGCDCYSSLEAEFTTAVTCKLTDVIDNPWEE